MKQNVDIKAPDESLESEEFQIRILRDVEDRPSVVCCKMPTPKMGLSFDLKIFNVGTKDVRVVGKVAGFKEKLDFEK